LVATINFSGQSYTLKKSTQNPLTAIDLKGWGNCGIRARGFDEGVFLGGERNGGTTTTTSQAKRTPIAFTQQ